MLEKVLRNSAPDTWNTVIFFFLLPKLLMSYFGTLWLRLKIRKLVREFVGEVCKDLTLYYNLGGFKRHSLSLRPKMQTRVPRERLSTFPPRRSDPGSAVVNFCTRPVFSVLTTGLFSLARQRKVLSAARNLRWTMKRSRIVWVRPAGGRQRRAGRSRFSLVSPFDSFGRVISVGMTGIWRRFSPSKAVHVADT